jgi:hypothetical protein
MSTRFASVEKPATGMPTAGETPFSLDIFLLGEQKKVSRGAGRSARGPDKQPSSNPKSVSRDDATTRRESK